MLFRGETQLKFPWECLQSLITSRNERLLIANDFEHSDSEWTVAGVPAVPQLGEHLSGTHSLVVPSGETPLVFRRASFPRIGRVQWYLYDPSPLSSKPRWRIELKMSDPVGATAGSSSPPWRLVLQPTERGYSSNGPSEFRLTNLPVVRESGWRQWTLLLTEDQTLLCIDGKVLAIGPVLSRPLASLSFLAMPGAASASNSGVAPRVEDFLLTEPNALADAAIPYNSQPRTLLWRSNGDELFGNVTQFSSRAFTLATSKQSKQFPSADVAGVIWPVSPGVAKSEPTRGWQVWVELTDGLWSRMRGPDRLCVALQNIEGDRLVADHPVLGRLRLPLREVRRIEPLFSGERRLLATGPVHLGDEAHADFSVPLPSGTRFESTVIFDRLPVGKCFCTFEVEDLEPSGPNTPENSPHLAALQAGHLQTQLLINGRLVGDLNRHISQRAKPGNPLRLRIPLPDGLMQTGKNVFRLQQQPAQDDPRSFDDCQISQWALECEQDE